MGFNRAFKGLTENITDESHIRLCVCGVVSATFMNSARAVWMGMCSGR